MNKRILYPLVFFWFVSVGLCIFAIERYANTAGDLAPADLSWPADSALALSNERPTVLLFAHPRCPCTKATLEQFKRIEARHPGAYDLITVFTVPEAAPDQWTDSGLIRDVRSAMTAEVFLDEGGIEATRFQASVSGQVMLFAPAGHLAFSGGITPARGHEGGNGGQDALEYAIQHPDGEALTFPVFGCGLVTHGEKTQGEAVI